MALFSLTGRKRDQKWKGLSQLHWRAAAFTATPGKVFQHPAATAGCLCCNESSQPTASQLARVTAEPGRHLAADEGTDSRHERERSRRVRLGGGLCCLQGGCRAGAGAGCTPWQQQLPPAVSVPVLEGETELVLLEEVQDS